MGGVLVAIDQLGNTIAGGNPDATISARTGYFSHVEETTFRPYWLTMERVIDFTFLPIILIIAARIPLSLVARPYVLVFPVARFSS